jgi:hypothetical protein
MGDIPMVFRISKFILPLKGKYFIETTLLTDLKAIPEDLSFKTFIFFSGTGVIFT